MKLRRPCEHGRYETHHGWDGGMEVCPGGVFLPEGFTDDELLAELERRDVFEPHHIYEVGESSIAVQHPIRCRMYGKALLDCEAGKVALSLTEPPAPPGRRYTAALENGCLVGWAPIDGETP